MACIYLESKNTDDGLFSVKWCIDCLCHCTRKRQHVVCYNSVWIRNPEKLPKSSTANKAPSTIGTAVFNTDAVDTTKKDPRGGKGVQTPRFAEKQNVWAPAQSLAAHSQNWTAVPFTKVTLSLPPSSSLRQVLLGPPTPSFSPDVQSVDVNTLSTMFCASAEETKIISRNTAAVFMLVRQKVCWTQRGDREWMTLTAEMEKLSGHFFHTWHLLIFSS